MRNISFSDLNENEGEQDSLGFSESNFSGRNTTSFHRKVNSFNNAKDFGHKGIESNNKWSETRGFGNLNSSSEYNDGRISANDFHGKSLKYKEEFQNSEVDDKIRNLEGIRIFLF